MDIVDIRPDLRMLVAAPGQAYLLRHRGGVVLVDTGRVGNGERIAAALRDWGLDRDALTDVLLTHWHADHTGSASEVGAWPGVRLWAHHADAPVIRGERAGDPPAFTEAEATFHAQVAGDLPDAPPARVDQELADGQLLDELRIQVLATPGHTDGSVALLAPDAGVLFTGDIAAEQDGAVVLGPFNTDRSRARSSFRRLASLQSDLDVVCFGHGRPLRGPDTDILWAAATGTSVPDPFGG